MFYLILITFLLVMTAIYSFFSITTDKIPNITDPLLLIIICQLLYIMTRTGEK